MKTEAQFLAAVRNRLDGSWASELVAEVIGGVIGGVESRWPRRFALGSSGKGLPVNDFPRVVAWASGWREFAARHALVLEQEGRRVSGTSQQVPARVLVEDVDRAAALVGDGWVERLARGRARVVRLHQEFPHLAEQDLLAATLKDVDAYSETDVDILVQAGAWFAVNDAVEMTPRQVPIEGAHAKWLNTRQPLVRRLARVDDLGLIPNHPARVHFTYLDPDHLATGGRRHDSVTLGDAMAPAYVPRVVLITENKDTAINFPLVAGGVSVEGEGRGGRAVAAVDWLVGAERVFYWGDMDADGLEILDEFRAVGVPAVSLFMDLVAYERWEHLGTNEDPKGRPLGPREPRPVPHLTDAEAELYRALCSPGWTRVRRVEQERIPLATAVDRLLKIWSVSQR